MGSESGGDEKAQRFRDYLGPPEPTASGSYKKSQENDIIEGIYSAIKSGRKYYVQIVKSFNLPGLNSALFYIHTNLSEKGIDIKPLEKLDFAQTGIESKNNLVYLISEKYLDVSDQVTLQMLSNLIGGIVPKELAWKPILLGLTDETLRKVRKFQKKRTLENFSTPSQRQQANNGVLGAGLILLSITFLVTGIGIIFYRPALDFLSLFTISWIIFSLSIIGILGFVLVSFGHLQTRSTKKWTIGVAFLIIAATEVASILIQTSSLSMDKSLGLELVIPFGFIFHRLNTYILPEIYTVLALLLATACYLLIYSFADRFFKILGLIALILAIAAEVITFVGVLRIPNLTSFQAIISYSHFLYISFYNNVTPILPYPSVMLNATVFIPVFQNYTDLLLYLELGLAAISNFLFSLTYIATGVMKARQLSFDQGDDSTIPLGAS